MKRKILGGTTSFIDRVFFRDTSQTTKVVGLTGLTSSSSGLTLYYCRSGSNSTTSVSLSAGTLGTWSSGGFVEIDSTHMPGWYEYGVPNAALASGAISVGLHFRGATNMEDVPIQIELDAVNYQDAVRFGLTSLPSSGTLAVNPTINATQSYNNTGQTTKLAVTLASTDVTGNVACDLQTIKTQAVTASAGVTFPTSIGTSTYSGGAVASVTAGVTVTTNNDKTGYSLSQAFPANFSSLGIGGTGKITGVVLTDTVTTYTGNTPQTGDNYARLGSPTGASIAADIQTRSTYSGADTSGTTTLLARLTSTRATNMDNLDAAISTRSTYAGADTAGTTSLLLALVPYSSTVNDALSTTTVIDTALTGTADLTGSKVVFTSGTLKGVYRTIASMNTTTGQITLLSALPSAPANTSPFSIVQGSKALEQFLSLLGTDNRVKVSGDAHTSGETIAAVTGAIVLPATTPANFITTSSFAAGTTIPRATLVDTITTYTGNTPQTGDSFARIGLAGVGLTNLGDTRIANLDATVSSRSTYAGGDTSGVTTLLARLTSTRSTNLDNLDAAISTRSTYAGGAVASVTAGVTVSTNNDKTGYSLTQAFPTNFSSLGIGGTGKISGVVLVDTVTTYTGNTPQTGDNFARIGVAGAGLTALGDTRLAHLDADVSTRSTYAGVDTSGTTTLLSRLTSGRAGNLDNISSVPPSAATIATTVRDVDNTSPAVGSLGAKVNSSAAVGDPWNTSLPGSYASGTAGNIVGNRVDATISSRSTYAGGDTGGVTTLLGRVTSTRANNLDNLDAAVSTRSTYAGGDTSGVTTLVGRLTSTRATNLDNLDAAVSSRSTYSGGAVASVTAGVTVTTNNDKTGYSLTQAFPTNFSSLGITSGGKISGVVLTDTATTYTGNTPQTGDNFARIGVAGVGLTALGDTRLAHLDADISTRSVYAGGAVASVTGGVTVTTNNDKTGYRLDLTQPITDVQTATIGGALAGAWANAWGKVLKDVVNKLLQIWGPGNSTNTASKTFNLDDGTNPLERS